jgi:hypothetical protein
VLPPFETPLLPPLELLPELLGLPPPELPLLPLTLPELALLLPAAVETGDDV